MNHLTEEKTNGAILTLCPYRFHAMICFLGPDMCCKYTQWGHSQMTERVEWQIKSLSNLWGYKLFSFRLFLVLKGLQNWFQHTGSLRLVMTTFIGHNWLCCEISPMTHINSRSRSQRYSQKHYSDWICLPKGCFVFPFDTLLVLLLLRCYGKIYIFFFLNWSLFQ